MDMIKGFFRFIAELVALHIAVFALALLGPALFVLPFVLIHQNPTENYTWLALTLFWVTPLSAGFYTNLSYHVCSVKDWRRNGGQPGMWSRDNGGLLSTGMRSIAIMFSAWLASYVFELAFVYAFSHVPFTSAMTRQLVGFALMPFATYAPVILFWTVRGMRRNEYAVA